MIERINLSKGSASQGLRYLLDLGAARTVYVAGDRRAHYEAVAELRNLANRFLQQQVFSYFEGSSERLDRIAVEARKLPGEQREFALARVKMLKSWERNARFILPVLMKLLGGQGEIGDFGARWQTKQDVVGQDKIRHRTSGFWEQSPNGHGRQLGEWSRSTMRRLGVI